MSRGSSSCIRAGVEVLTLLVEFDVKGALRETIDFDLFDFTVAQVEPVTAFRRHKLDFIFAKMQPAATVIGDVVGVEFFMRVSDEEGCAATSFEGVMEIFERSSEIQVEVEICCRHVG